MKYCSLPEQGKYWSAFSAIVPWSRQQDCGASSYLTLHKGVSADTAASFASMFYLGITVGRALSGFLTMKLNNVQMIRLGEVIIGIGVLVMLLPFGQSLSLTGLILIGLGCAPVYPCVIHSTPAHFWCR